MQRNEKNSSYGDCSIEAVVKSCYLMGIFFSAGFLNPPFNMLGNDSGGKSQRYAKIKLGLIIIFYN